MKTVQRTTLSALITYVLVGIYSNVYGQSVLLGDTLDLTKNGPNYITLRLISAKVISRNMVAIADLGLPTPPKGESVPYPSLTDGKQKYSFQTITGFINLMDRAGFDYLNSYADEVYIYALFRRRKQ